MNIFSYIKSRVNILDIVGEYTQLKRAGHYWKGNCPFHHEKTASFTVSPHKEIFYCFGCHEGGDVIAFISKIEQCTQIEAARHLAEQHSIDLPEEISNETSSQHSDNKKQYFEICRLVAAWAHEQLRKNSTVLHYVKKRSIDDDRISQFSIGYFPGGLAAIKSLIDYVGKHQILAHDLIKANILAEGKTVLYSPFENRIIFPIKDHLGRSCGFGGRTFKADDERAKYYNSRENEHFNKGSILFGLDAAKQSIKETGVAFLVEGYTDCIAMVQHGYPNTVATLGTACTLDHLHLLARYGHELYVVYDGDNAGRQAVLRLTQLCWQVNIEPNVITLPQGNDPADFLQNGGDLTPLIEQAKDIFGFFIDTAATQFTHKNLHQKLQAAEQLIEIIKKIDAPLKQDILLQKAAVALDLPFESLKSELTQARLRMRTGQKDREPNPEETPIQAPDCEASKLEMKLFFDILNNIKLFNRDNSDFLTTYLSEPLRTILHKLKELQEANPDTDFPALFESLTTHEQQFVSRCLLSHNSDDAGHHFEQLLLQVQRHHWRSVIAKVKKDLAQAKLENNEQRAQDILRDFLVLKKKLLSGNLI